MKAWTDEECLALLRRFASGAAMMSPDIMFSPAGLYALIRAAVDEARREEREACAAVAFAECCHDCCSRSRGGDVCNPRDAILARSEVPRESTVRSMMQQEVNAAESRVEALEAVLREAPQMSETFVLRRVRYKAWLAKRDAALADEPRKETT